MRPPLAVRRGGSLAIGPSSPMAKHAVSTCAVVLVISGCASSTSAQQTRTTVPTAERVSSVPAAVPRSDYIIGAEDVLTVVFWRDKEMSGDVVVRPDGKISVPLLRDVDAAGSTPDQLGGRLGPGGAQDLDR